MVFSEAGPVPAQGEIAQQIFWYTAFTADMVKEGLPVVNEAGTPKWRMAPSPHGAYWEEGQQLGYQIGRASVRTPVTHAHLVCRRLLQKKNEHIILKKKE